MNRHRWFLTVMAMVVGVALAGPAMGTKHFTKKVQPWAIPPILEITKIKFQGPGAQWTAQPGSDYATVTAAGEHAVTAEVKNLGTSQTVKGAKKCKITVTGGKQVGTYGWSYHQDFTVDDVPKLNPGEVKNACYQKVAVTDTGKYFIYVSLIKP